MTYVINDEEETCGSQKEWIQKYQLEKIFPAHYFDKLQMISFSAGQAICRQGEELQALSYFVKGKIKIVRRLFNGKEHILNIQENPPLLEILNC